MGSHSLLKIRPVFRRLRLLSTQMSLDLLWPTADHVPPVRRHRSCLVSSTFSKSIPGSSPPSLQARVSTSTGEFAQNNGRLRTRVARPTMVIGHNQPVRGEDDARTQFTFVACLGFQRDHAGQHLGGDLLDRRRRREVDCIARRTSARRNNCPPTAGGRTSTATAKLIAANNIATAKRRTMNVPARAGLCRSAVTDIAQ
jgi:hypothetical protein